MKPASHFQNRARQLRLPRGYRPLVESLEERLPPGDAVLGGLLTRSMFGAGLASRIQAPAVAGETQQRGASLKDDGERTTREAHVAKVVAAMLRSGAAQLKTVAGVTYLVMSPGSPRPVATPTTEAFDMFDFTDGGSVKAPRRLVGVDEDSLDVAPRGAAPWNTAVFGLALDGSQTTAASGEVVGHYETAAGDRGNGLVLVDVSAASPAPPPTPVAMEAIHGGGGPLMPEGPIPPDTPPTDDCDDCDCSCSSGGGHGIGGPPDSGLGPPHKGPGGHGPFGKAPGAPGIPSSLSFSAAPVRYFDGTVKLMTDDLPPSDLGTPWGHTRSWTNHPGYTGAINQG